MFRDEQLGSFCVFNSAMVLSISEPFILRPGLIFVVIIKGDDGVSCASEISSSLSLPPVLLRSDLRSHESSGCSGSKTLV